MAFNKEKMKQVIHYIIDCCQHKPNFGKTVLYKLMYFSDFNHYELYETLITDEKYEKKPFGPVPCHFDLITDELIQENKIKYVEKPFINYIQKRHCSLKKPDTSLLSEKVLGVINSVIDKLSHMNAGEISEYSHGDKPWRVAKFEECLDPEFVFYRNDEYSVREYDD